MLNAVLFWTLTKALTPGGNSFKWSFLSHAQVTTKAHGFLNAHARNQDLRWTSK